MIDTNMKYGPGWARFSVDALRPTPLDHASLILTPLGGVVICFATRFLLFYQFGLLSNRYTMFVLSLIFTLKRMGFATLS
ncbi:hypothetical protein ACNKHW_07925 [Shigella flexneri]